MNASRKPLFGFGLVVGAAFLWAVIPISLKKIGDTFDAYTITWLRFAVSAVLLFVFAYTQGEIKRLQKRDVWLMVLAGGGIGFNYVLYTLGIKFTTASAGNVVVNLEAVWLVILGRLWLKERIGGLKLAGTLITFAGVFAAIWTGDGFCALIKSKYFGQYADCRLRSVLGDIWRWTEAAGGARRSGNCHPRRNLRGRSRFCLADGGCGLSYKPTDIDVCMDMDVCADSPGDFGVILADGKKPGISRCFKCRGGQLYSACYHHSGRSHLSRRNDHIYGRHGCAFGGCRYDHHRKS